MGDDIGGPEGLQDIVLDANSSIKTLNYYRLKNLTFKHSDSRPFTEAGENREKNIGNFHSFYQ